MTILTMTEAAVLTAFAGGLLVGLMLAYFVALGG
jgi:hypothetical protein